MTSVDPDVAIKAMTSLWRSYGNEISEPLLNTWRTMCDTLNRAGQNQEAVGWSVLAMPTGIGKTQFAALYCALLPNPTFDSLTFRTADMHPGVLFVTRFIAEATKFVALVNELAGKEIAAAYYADSSVSLGDASRFPILAITHAACERHQINANTADNDGTGAIWDRLVSWHQSRRAKVIIDETPNFITSVQIKANYLAHTIAALKHLSDANSELYFDLEVLLAMMTDTRLATKSRELFSGELELVKRIDISSIRQHLSTVDDYALTVSDGTAKISFRKVCQITLTAIEAVRDNGWGWVSWRGPTAQLNSAALHPSLRNGSGIILDGTAALFPGYGLLSPPAKIISAPIGVRNYESVTLHVARGHKAGKGYLTENAAHLWPTYKLAIETALPNAERVLVCCHKDVRDKINVDPLSRMSFAHYGDIDGRNDWASYEAVALVGLPYLDGATPANLAQALMGVQTSEWLQVPAYRCTSASARTDILSELHRGYLSASIVQAISRVRCRSAKDSSGRCARTSVFIALPNGADGDTVLASIVSCMPGIQVRAWEVDVASSKRRTAPTTDALVDFFTAAPPASYTKAQVRLATDVPPASLDRAIRRMSSATSQERRRLDPLRVTYQPQYGQGAQSYFVKA